MSGLEAFFWFLIICKIVALIVWCMVGEKYLNNNHEVKKEAKSEELPKLPDGFMYIYMVGKDKPTVEAIISSELWDN